MSLPPAASGPQSSPDVTDEVILEFLTLNISGGEAEAATTPSAIYVSMQRLKNIRIPKANELIELCRLGLKGDQEDMNVFEAFLSLLIIPLLGMALGSEYGCIHAELWLDEDEENNGASRGVLLKIWIPAFNWQHTSERLAMFERNLRVMFDNAKEIRNLHFDQVRVKWLVSFGGYTYSPPGATFSHSNRRKPLRNSVEGFPIKMLNLGWFTNEGVQVQQWSPFLYEAEQAEAEGWLIIPQPLSSSGRRRNPLAGTSYAP
ncbi:hypothetical protein F4803DRAFT_551806 [Xylaria telfairii]|nr:hypothetical protein F4803DRAFT_551806 [Xylaria telfairii]